ncbi:AI-2E family transporter [Clostridium sp. KNHs214]|uniref:AI-2E family transporter n=1 Tax=Clostridium sp. KNHs214 TaxID=1540257 RepID=UPI002570AF71|nr:AI-2E family transporter [Clostridium sp. KNHs214]
MNILIKNKKIPYLNLIPILIISFLLFKFIDNIDLFAKSLKTFFSIISSFIWAFSIAYILSPAVNYLEKKFKLKRTISLLIVYTIVLGSIVLLITRISPKITHSISDLVKNIPDYIDKTKHWIDNSNLSLDFLDKLGINLDEKITDLAGKFTTSIGEGLNIALAKAITITSSFFKAILGFIISVYILKDKEKFKYGFKRFLYATLKEETVDKIIHVSKEVDNIFLKYIIGKAIDSFIIGILCFIGLSILKAPFALFLSLIVGVTNMIPYFGPFIGMIPAFVITLFYNPIKAIWVLIFIFALQQFDGLYLGPKILGDKVGLSPFWIILAIVVGGGTFGVIGMFLSVPVIAVLKTFLDDFISKKLSE